MNFRDLSDEENEELYGEKEEIIKKSVFLIIYTGHNVERISRIISTICNAFKTNNF